MQVSWVYLYPDDLVYTSTDPQSNRDLLPWGCVEWSILW